MTEIFIENFDGSLTDGKVYASMDGKHYLYDATASTFTQVDPPSKEPTACGTSNPDNLHARFPTMTPTVDEEREMDALLDEDTPDCESHAMRSYWTTPIDLAEAADLTLLLIKLVTGPEFAPKFKKPGIKKKSVWEQVAQKYIDLGYPIPSLNIMEAGRKAKGKWNNLLKMKNLQNKKMTTTGLGNNKRRRNSPKYYDEIVDATRNMEQHNPTHIIDSYPLTSIASSSNTQPPLSSPLARPATSSSTIPLPNQQSFCDRSSTSSSPNSDSSPASLFSNTKSSTRPPNRVAAVVQQLQAAEFQAELRHKERMAELKEYNSRIETLMQKDLDIKAALLDFLKKGSTGP